MSQEPTNVVEVFRERVREARRLRGLTQDEVSARTAAFGLAIDRGALSKIEGGTRGVSLGEGLVLAAALGSPFADLFAEPGDPDIKVQFGDAPGAEVFSAVHIRHWLRGEAGLSGDDEPYSRRSLPSLIGNTEVARALTRVFMLADIDPTPARQIEVAEAAISILQGLIPALRLEVPDGSR